VKIVLFLVIVERGVSAAELEALERTVRVVAAAESKEEAVAVTVQARDIYLRILITCCNMKWS
jgi:DNA-binding transcriptional regulator LsrR (DeoR family)